MRTPFTGVGTALITPFTQGRLPRRSGGHAPGAAADRRRRALPVAVRDHRRGADADASREAARRGTGASRRRTGKVPVLAGAGGYDTREVIELARDMERVGADGLLSVTPYYNKPTQEGPVPALQGDRRERRRCRSCSTTCPGRTGVNIDVRYRRSGCPRFRTSSRSRKRRRTSSRCREIIAGAPRGLHRPERRRSADGAGDGDRRQAASSRWRPTKRRPRWRRSSSCARRATSPPRASCTLAAAAHSGQLRRNQPDPVQGGDGGDGTARGELPAADGAAERRRRASEVDARPAEAQDARAPRRARLMTDAR